MAESNDEMNNMKNKTKAMNAMAKTNNEATNNTKNDDPNDVMMTTNADEVWIDKNEEMSDNKGHYGNANDDGIDNNPKKETKDNRDNGYAGANDETLTIITKMLSIDKAKELSEAEADDKDWCSHCDTGCIQHVMLNDCGVSTHQ